MAGSCGGGASPAGPAGPVGWLSGWAWMTREQESRATASRAPREADVMFMGSLTLELEVSEAVLHGA